ncbi:hypothetical protein ACIBEJ_00395 [Nonomuraea sp. NPDC050790]|uniref:hypothetical protein n=1 Tax=Nonomuraea sp. NPDC050790 TaxID=3364371 RepID=UPI0037BA6D30
MIGYGTAPIPAAGVWLHAGAPLLAGWGIEDEGPDYYLITRSKERPTSWHEVLGIIGQARHRSRQVKSRWHAGTHFRFPAGLHYSPHLTLVEDRLKSRTAAVRWVIEQATGGSEEHEAGPDTPGDRSER